MGNLDSVRELTTWWNARDLDATMAVMGDEIVLDWSRSDGPLNGIYRGKEAVREFFTAFFEAWADYANEITQAHEIGDDIVVTEVFGGGTGAGSGATVTARGAMAWRFSGQHLVGIEMFQSYDDALASLQSR